MTFYHDSSGLSKCSWRPIVWEGEVSKQDYSKKAQGMATNANLGHLNSRRRKKKWPNNMIKDNSVKSTHSKARPYFQKHRDIRWAGSKNIEVISWPFSSPNGKVSTNHSLYANDKSDDFLLACCIILEYPVPCFPGVPSGN